MAVFRFLKKEWFLGGMIGAVVLAAFTAEWGRGGGPLHGDLLADAAIALVFFLHGLGISTRALRNGMLRWRVHLFVQSCTFVVFPLIWVVAYALVGRWLPPGLALGFCYLCALPSTISSSVAMTAMARGDVPVAIFNATLSSLLGIVATPLLVAAFTGVQGHGWSMWDAVVGIARLLLLPLLLGQLLRPVLHGWHARHKHLVHRLDRWAILLLVYTAFCDSTASGLWRDNGPDVLLTTLLGAALILTLVLWLTTRVVRRLGFSVEEEIAAVFCASKKTMASGVPMARLLFGLHPSMGLILLPVMLYHQLQLFVCAWMASRYAARADDGR